MAGGFLGRLALLLMSGGALDKVQEEGEELPCCSRKRIEAAGSGRGKWDYVEAALWEAYRSDEFAQRYGETFEIDDAYGKFVEEGQAFCYLRIGEDCWCAQLEQPPRGRWQVLEWEQVPEADFL